MWKNGGKPDRAPGAANLGRKRFEGNRKGGWPPGGGRANLEAIKIEPAFAVRGHKNGTIREASAALGGGMQLAEQFEPKSEAGFVRACNAQDARRQFHVSLALVLLLAAAAAALALLAQIDRRPDDEAAAAGASGLPAMHILPRVAAGAAPRLSDDEP